MTFRTLGLNETLLQAVEETGYTTPTPIQAKAIPAILSGSDVMAAAQTGTGKTAGFTLPLIQLLGAKPGTKANHVRALILTPTRELAAQIQDSIETYGKNDKMRSVVVFGGVKINPQLMALRKGADILVATPGRLLDLYQQNAVKFTDLEVLILDEADRMLDMGFIRDIRRILPLLPKQRQNLMFSATFSDEIRQLARTICNKPVEIDVAPRNSTVEIINQSLYMVKKESKADLLTHILKGTSEQTLVFSRTKHGANKMVKRLLKDGITALAIHGNKSQPQRTKALADFKQNRVQVLVATDIAARGIDIDELSLVINFDIPNVPEDYVHRIGRTGRAGASGQAISLVSGEESKQLRDIERLIKMKIERAETPAFAASTAEERAADERDERVPRQGRSQGARGNGGRQQANRKQASGEQPSRNRSGSQSRRRGGAGASSTAGRTSGRSSERVESSARTGDANGNRSDSRNDNRSAHTHHSSDGKSQSTASRIRRFFSPGSSAA